MYLSESSICPHLPVKSNLSNPPCSIHSKTLQLSNLLSLYNLCIPLNQNKLIFIDGPEKLNRTKGLTSLQDLCNNQELAGIDVIYEKIQTITNAALSHHPPPPLKKGGKKHCSNSPGVQQPQIIRWVSSIRFQSPAILL